MGRDEGLYKIFRPYPLFQIGVTTILNSKDLAELRLRTQSELQRAKSYAEDIRVYGWHCVNEHTGVREDRNTNLKSAMDKFRELEAKLSRIQS